MHKSIILSLNENINQQQGHIGPQCLAKACFIMYMAFAIHLPLLLQDSINSILRTLHKMDFCQKYMTQNYSNLYLHQIINVYF